MLDRPIGFGQYMASQGKNRNAEQGESIEQYRARRRGGEHTPGEWFDVMDGWQPVEVKSTQRRINTDPELVSSPRNGRWRLWRDQHEKMVEQGGEYDFVVIDDDGDDDENESGDIWRETTVSADRVSEIIEQNELSWTGAGKHGMPTEQVKIPWTYVIDR